MLEVGKAMYYLFALSAAVIAIAAIMRQGRAEVVFLSVSEKMTRSIKVGAMVGVLPLLLLMTFQVSSWDGHRPAIDVGGTISMAGCLIAPFSIIAAVGTFLQLMFMEFLIRRNLKR